MNSENKATNDHRLKYKGLQSNIERSSPPERDQQHKPRTKSKLQFLVTVTSQQEEESEELIPKSDFVNTPMLAV